MIYRTVVRVWKWNVADWIFINLLINVYLLFINPDMRHFPLWISDKCDFIELWDFELLSQASNSVVFLGNRREGTDLFLPLETILCACCLNSSVFVQGTGKGGFCLVQYHKHIKYESSPDSGNAWECHAEKCHCVLCLEILHEINEPEAFPVLLPVFVSSTCEEQCSSPSSVDSKSLNNFLVLIKAPWTLKWLKFTLPIEVLSQRSLSSL